jgi:uncharacterized membrane protein
MSHIAKNILPKWLKFVLVVTIVLGICFRLINIDRKIYWHDEVYTSIRISGYTLNEITRELQEREIISVRDIQKYQFPNSNKSLKDTIASLAIDEPQLPPLYFILARLWTNLFGNSIVVIRSLSVLFGLLALPCIYWLCLELFESTVAGWIAMGILAISPLHILYSQEARMYSLHIVNILLSSTIFLRAIKQENKLNWLLYTITVSLGLYTHPLFGFVLLVHGIYLVIHQRFRNRKTLIAYAIASSLGFLSFVPWILIIFNGLNRVDRNLNWLNDAPSLAKIVTYWLANYTKILFDLKSDYRFSESIPHLLSFGIFSLASLGLLGYSIYYFYRHSLKKEYYFVLLLIFVPALLLAVPDLLLGGSRSIHLRYAIPTYLGCQLVFAYVFSQKLLLDVTGVTSIAEGKTANNSVGQQTLWSVILVCTLLIGIISNRASFQQAAWWNKYFNTDNLAISELINQEPSSITICYQCNRGMGFGNLTSLSYHLSDRTKIQMLTEFEENKIPNDAKTIFLFNPPAQLPQEISTQSNLHLENIYQNYLSLWKIQK